MYMQEYTDDDKYEICGHKYFCPLPLNGMKPLSASSWKNMFQ